MDIDQWKKWQINAVECAAKEMVELDENFEKTRNKLKELQYQNWSLLVELSKAKSVEKKLRAALCQQRTKAIEQENAISELKKHNKQQLSSCFADSADCAKDDGFESRSATPMPVVDSQQNDALKATILECFQALEHKMKGFVNVVEEKTSKFEMSCEDKFSKIQVQIDEFNDRISNSYSYNCSQLDDDGGELEQGKDALTLTSSTPSTILSEMSFVDNGVVEVEDAVDVGQSLLDSDDITCPSSTRSRTNSEIPTIAISSESWSPDRENNPQSWHSHQDSVLQQLSNQSNETVDADHDGKYDSNGLSGREILNRIPDVDVMAGQMEEYAKSVNSDQEKLFRYFKEHNTRFRDIKWQIRRIQHMVNVGNINVNEKDCHFKGYTALHHCCRNFNLPWLLEMLIQHASSTSSTGVDAVDDDDGNTPLLVACLNQYFQLVPILIKHGADPNFTNRHGETALILACRSCHVSLQVVEMLVEKMTPQSLNQVCQVESQTWPFGKIISAHSSALHCAVAAQLDVEIVQKLLQNGADRNCENERSQTPFNLLPKTNCCHELSNLLSPLPKHY